MSLKTLRNNLLAGVAALALALRPPLSCKSRCGGPTKVIALKCGLQKLESVGF